MPKPKKVFRGSSLENEAPQMKQGMQGSEGSEPARQQRTIFSGSGNIYSAVLQGQNSQSHQSTLQPLRLASERYEYNQNGGGAHENLIGGGSITPSDHV